jgi:hypothetical protein
MCPECYSGDGRSLRDSRSHYVESWYLLKASCRKPRTRSGSWRPSPHVAPDWQLFGPRSPDLDRHHRLPLGSISFPFPSHLKRCHGTLECPAGDMVLVGIELVATAGARIGGTARALDAAGLAVGRNHRVAILVLHLHVGEDLQGQCK